MLRRLGLIIRDQKGFTLIEMIVAIAISSAIGGGILLSIYQTSSYQAMEKARMNCVKNVENAIHYIIRDAQMAQEIDTDYDADGFPFPLYLTWTEWDADVDANPEYKHEVTYTLDDGSNELQRHHVAYDAIGGENKNDTNVVARYIDPDPDKTNCGYIGGVLNLELTATITGFPKEISETRNVEIIPRPDW
jgi:prepilin-type N-terminal cleavage/methylation domain-containing protein